jgi:hypothetical protein
MWRRVFWQHFTEVSETYAVSISECKEQGKQAANLVPCWLLLNPEDGDNTFLRNVGKLLPNYAESHLNPYTNETSILIYF